ncbi:hypothetical protein [Rhodopirellula sp. P2]|uniref:hypothetical protein n=1 Tax=Rhodopirellula sp. P2 TaxID=2127060 RepID=UPI0023675F5D|nr:hypothetical protein [Rhodopirellula sp. P2]WDQ15733.1 hypothetical protein PSR62_19080 [Rhodopirellula sp. P2]
MRNLTLGTIIVVGGLLAAIPFRRDAVHPESSDPNALATGPTSAPFAIATSDPLTPPWDSGTTGAGQAASFSAQTHSTGWPNHRAPDPPSQGYAAPSRADDFVSTGPGAIPTEQAARSRRDSRLPLTYDDLAVPLSSPHFPDERYNALAGSPSNPLPRQRSMPPIGKAEARVQGSVSSGSVSSGSVSSGSVSSGPLSSGGGQIAARPTTSASANLASNPDLREESTPAQLASSVPGSQLRPDARQQVLRPPTVDLQRQPPPQESTRSRSFRIPEVEMPAMPAAPSVMERQRHWIRQPE